MTPTPMYVAANPEMLKQQRAALEIAGERLGFLIESLHGVLVDALPIPREKVDTLREAARGFFLQPIAEAIAKIDAYEFPAEMSLDARLVQLIEDRDQVAEQLADIERGLEAIEHPDQRRGLEVSLNAAVIRPLRLQLQAIEKNISTLQAQIEAADSAAAPQS